MKRKRNRKGTGTVRTGTLSVLMLLAVWAFTLPVNGQCAARNDAFQSGEDLTYDLFFNWKFVWIKAGYASMKTFSVPYQGKTAFRTSLVGVGSKRVDFFFKMRDTLTCIVSEKLEPLYYRKGAEEGKRYYVDEAWFRYRDGVSYVKQKKYRSWTGETEWTEQRSKECVFDMLSILLQARSFDPADYKEGQRINFPMVTGTEIENQTLIYRGRKEFKAENDTTYKCLVFSLVELKGKKEKEIITFYITDDWNHIPVRLDMYLNFGSAKAFLKEIRGNRHPLSSIVR